MNKFLSVLLFLFSFSLVAAEYRTEVGMCEFKVKESDMFNATERELPFKFQLQYILSFERNTSRFLGARKKIISQINSTSAVNEYELQQIADSIEFYQSPSQNPMTIHMNLNSERVRTLVTYAGSYRAIQGNVTLPSINTRLSGGCGRVQSHLDPSDNDGLSYHIEWCCDGATTTPPGQSNGGGRCTQNGKPVPCPIPGNPGQNPGQGSSVCYQAGRRVPCPVTTRPTYPTNQSRVCISNGARVPCPRY